MVANQGASPSGRLTAVLGRSGSVGRLEGCCSDEASFELDGTRGLCVFDVFRVPAGVIFRVALGGVVVVTAAYCVPGLRMVGEVAPDDFISERAPSAESGVPLSGSVSSSKFWLPMLFPLVLSLGLESVSSSSMLPLMLRFLGIGVSRSNLSEGIGNGLDVKIGILDPLFRTTGVP